MIVEISYNDLSMTYELSSLFANKHFLCIMNVIKRYIYSYRYFILISIEPVETFKSFTIIFFKINFANNYLNYYCNYYFNY